MDSEAGRFDRTFLGGLAERSLFQRDQGILDVDQRRQDGPPVGLEELLALGEGELQLSAQPSTVENRLRQPRRERIDGRLWPQQR